jgi:hypothetical protein
VIFLGEIYHHYYGAFDEIGHHFDDPDPHEFEADRHAVGTGPQPNFHSPPIAHAPNPTVVISGPLEPSLLVCICYASRGIEVRTPFVGRSTSSISSRYGNVSQSPVPRNALAAIR